MFEKTPQITLFRLKEWSTWPAVSRCLKLNTKLISGSNETVYGTNIRDSRKLLSGRFRCSRETLSVGYESARFKETQFSYSFEDDSIKVHETMRSQRRKLFTLIDVVHVPDIKTNAYLPVFPFRRSSIQEEILEHRSTRRCFRHRKLKRRDGNAKVGSWDFFAGKAFFGMLGSFSFGWNLVRKVIGVFSG